MSRKAYVAAVTILVDVITAAVAAPAHGADIISLNCRPFNHLEERDLLAQSHSLVSLHPTLLLQMNVIVMQTQFALAETL